RIFGSRPPFVYRDSPSRTGITSSRREASRITSLSGSRGLRSLIGRSPCLESARSERHAAAPSTDRRCTEGAASVCRLPRFREPDPVAAPDPDRARPRSADDWYLQRWSGENEDLQGLRDVC